MSPTATALSARPRLLDMPFVLAGLGFAGLVLVLVTLPVLPVLGEGMLASQVLAPVSQRACVVWALLVVLVLLQPLGSMEPSRSGATASRGKTAPLLAGIAVAGACHFLAGLVMCFGPKLVPVANGGGVLVSQRLSVCARLVEVVALGLHACRWAAPGSAKVWLAGAGSLALAVVFLAMGPLPAAYARMAGGAMPQIVSGGLAIALVALAVVRRSAAMSIGKQLPWQCEYRVRMPDGSVRWHMSNAIPHREPDGSVVSHGFTMDITDRKRSEQEIERLAFYDALTGLPNRRLLLDRLQRSITACQRSKNLGALLFIDLDNFKDLNDTLGHDMGDQLLTQVATRLVSSVREADTVARFGGDEFFVMLDNLAPDTQSAAAQAETACTQLQSWSQHPATAHLTVAVNVNVSARQFRQPGFVAQVLQTLQNHHANPQKLKLELTESLLLGDIEDTITRMGQLKKQGVGFALDDFGTGYSSLSYLKRLPLDQLKIDQSFVRDVLTDPNDAAIVRTILALAKSLDMEVVAEGVETGGQLTFLRLHGCEAFQGGVFGRPVPVDLFVREHLAEGLMPPPVAMHRGPTP